MKISLESLLNLQIFLSELLTQLNILYTKCIIIVKITSKGCYPNSRNKPPTDLIQPTEMLIIDRTEQLLVP